MYVAREGVATSDLFRRPGSHTDLKLIVRRLAEGAPVQLSDYNFYTLASVIKVITFYFALCQSWTNTTVSGHFFGEPKYHVHQRNNVIHCLHYQLCFCLLISIIYCKPFVHVFLSFLLAVL